MRIVELFASKQGEGIWTGTESTFIRIGGCHLHCRFCDTPYASWELEQGEELSVEEIIGRALIFNRKHVIITGGEPMLFSELVPLTEQLEALDYTITIETSGTLDLPVRCHLMSISPKLSNSIPVDVSENILRRHEFNRSRLDVTQELVDRYPFQLKFVIDTPNDIDEMERFLEQFEKIPSERILLMPQAVTVEEMLKRETWITAYCEKKGYLYCPRMQIIWYGNKRGT